MSRPSHRRFVTVAAVLFVALAAGGGYAGAPAQDDDERSYLRTTTIVYDVRDILHVAADHPAPPALADLVAPVPSGPATADERLAGLIRAIEIAVDRRGWDGPRTPERPVRELNGNLIITTTAANHAIIERLLAERRAAAAVQVVVEAVFIEAGDLGAAEDRLRWTSLSGGNAVAMSTLSPQAARELRETAAGLDGATVLSSPRIILRDGQAGSVSVTSPRTIAVRDLDTVREMLEVTIEEGTELWIEPTATPDRRAIEIVVAASAARAGRVPSLDYSAALATRAVVADGRTLLLRMRLRGEKLVGAHDCGTAPPAVRREAFEDPHAPQRFVYLVLGARLIVAGDDDG